MKTTVELPDSLFRKAKAAAAEDGMPLKDFFAEAVRHELHRRAAPAARGPAWEKAFGGLRDLHRENRRIERLIAAEFETVDEEEWR